MNNNFFQSSNFDKILESDIRLHILIVFKDNSTILTEILVLRRIILRRIFPESIVLRRIFLRRIIPENFSEEDISENDGSEEDKSEEVIKLF